jgi:hypothetical protein
MDFLAPLPVRKILGVGAATARKPEAIGIATIATLRAFPESDLLPVSASSGGSWPGSRGARTTARSSLIGRRRAWCRRTREYVAADYGNGKPAVLSQ